MKKKEKLLNLLNSKRPILLDGAMGTMLHQRGIAINECFDMLNLTNPALVADVHREYIEAGAQIIYTNTFGANSFKLGRLGMEEKVAQINTAGVELARRIILASFKEILIAGDVGPLGVRLAPFGRVQLEEANKVFSEQIQSLVDAGVDLIVLETMTDLYEIHEAILAARNIDPDIPIVASMTFTRDDLTVLGDSPGKVACRLHEDGADVIGANCSAGPNQMIRILRQMRQAVPDGYFSVKPNAGWPEQSGGRIMYAAGPEYFGTYAVPFWEAGANMIGGCCGTTPQHIAAFHQAIQASPEQLKIEVVLASSGEEEEIETKEHPTRLAEKLDLNEFVVTVEMEPPRGLSVHKLLAGASLLAESGTDVINVADSPMARMRMSPWAVCSLVQTEIGVETVLHFPTRGRNLLRVQGDLLAAHTLGVRNVFVVMGDPTAIGDYPAANDNYDLAPSGLIKMIKRGFNAGMDHAGSNIGEPTSFFIGGALNLNPPDMDRELTLLHRKIQAGVDFLLTQPIFESSLISTFLERYEEKFGKINLPILVGILPLASDRHASFLHHEVPGMCIPQDIHERMLKAGINGAREGIEITLELISGIRKYAQGIYIMPAFKRYDYAAEIVQAIKK
jgi:methionine synthase / methylenetetrahydrofolate reductase(NADPH)